MFNDNSAGYSGAVMASDNAKIAFNETCKVMFYNNSATIMGGAIIMFSNFIVKHQGKSMVKFNNNREKF